MSGSVRIMPLGDSITLGLLDDEPNRGGYRGPLHQKLGNAGYAVDFVGGDKFGEICDPDHEGHSSWRAECIRDKVYDWLTASRADIVLLHIGTNNISFYPAPDEKVRGTTNKIAQILDEVHRYETSSNTAITVILAQIINRADPLDLLGLATTALNASIASMAAARIAAGGRLVVANFEPALSYPADIADTVHPNASGYGKMATVWFDALVPLFRAQSVPVNINRRWQGPMPFGDARLSPGAPVSVFPQSSGVWAGLTVDQSLVHSHDAGRRMSRVGTMNVVWGDFNRNDGWQGPRPFGDAHLAPGAPVSVFQQSPGIWTGLTVDRAGTMNVVWGDFNRNDGWQGPRPFGDAHLAPGAQVSVFQQSPGVWAGLTVDRTGTMNVVWGDFNVNGGWQGPRPFGGAHLAPGAPVSVFQQSPGVWAGLTVDRTGTMNVVWGDFNVNGGWQGPRPFGGAHLAPGAPVTVFQQSPGVWAGLTVDRAGTMNVVWGDFNRNDGWKGPVPFGGAHLAPGAPISMFQQGPAAWAGLTVDNTGMMNVVWADLNASDCWRGPVAFGGAHLAAGAPVAVFEQSPGVRAGLTVDQVGRMNVVWLDPHSL
jgi:lysophospholipase L1-like esterase